jgi:short-subunit dehydrogenase
MDHSNTIALVTGASSGIGREFSRAFAARGADLVLLARRIEVLDGIAQALRAEFGTEVTTVALDLSQPDSGTRLLNELGRQGVHVDTVVNCAGIGRTGNFIDTAPADIEDQLTVNIDAVVDVCRAFLPGLLSSGKGALVNIASLTAYMPTPGMAVYAASKAFVLRFTEALAYELRGTGVTVMAFSPGPTRTEFYRNSHSNEKGSAFSDAPAGRRSSVPRAGQTETTGQQRVGPGEPVDEPHRAPSSPTNGSPSRELLTNTRRRSEVRRRTRRGCVRLHRANRRRPTAGRSPYLLMTLPKISAGRPRRGR